MKRLFVIMPHNFGNSIYLNIKERDRFYKGAWNVKASLFWVSLRASDPQSLMQKSPFIAVEIADQVRNDG